MSLELNAIPSVENLEFYRELASLEARYFVGFSNHINRGPLKGARYKNAHMMMNLFTDLITAKEENSEVDVYFIQKSCEAIIKSIEEDIPKAALEQKEIEEAKEEREKEERELEGKRSEQRIKEYRMESSRDSMLYFMEGDFKRAKRTVELSQIFKAKEIEKQEQEERKLEERELSKKLSSAIDREMYSIIYAIQDAATLKTVDSKSLGDCVAFVDENGDFRSSKNDVGYLTKDAKNHINNHIDAVREKKSELMEFKNKYDELTLEIKSVIKTLHPLNWNHNVLYEDGDVDAELAKLYEKLGLMSDSVTFYNAETSASEEYSEDKVIEGFVNPPQSKSPYKFYMTERESRRKIDELNKKIERWEKIRLLEREEKRYGINKKIEELEERRQLIETPEKVNKKIEDLEKVKQIIETPEEKQKRSRLFELSSLRRSALEEADEMCSKSVSKTTMQRLRLDREKKQPKPIEQVIDGVVKVLDEVENFWLDQKENLKSCVIDSVEGRIDDQALARDRKDISPTAIVSRLEGHSDNLIGLMSEYSDKFTDKSFDTLKQMASDIRVSKSPQVQPNQTNESYTLFGSIFKRK